MNGRQLSIVKSDVLSMVEAAVTAVDPYKSTLEHLTLEGNLFHVAGCEVDLAQINQLFVVAIGKAAVPMTQAVVDRLDGAVSRGIAVTKRGQTAVVEHPRVATLFGAHPVPDESSVLAADAVVDLLDGTAEGDFVLFLISGGASALCTRPLLPLDAWQGLSQTLLGSGCTIQEFNTVRKQLDQVKGGGLGVLAQPARIATLVLSDVIGNPIGMIGSGPTVPSEQRPEEALEVLRKYQIVHVEAERLLAELSAQTGLSWFESPYQITGDVGAAAVAAQKQAVRCGYRAQIVTTELVGEAREVGSWAVAVAQSLEPGMCAIAGGETTVTLHGDGLGGRNQELALAAAIALENVPDMVVATYATDGDDGPTPAAGAIVSGETVRLGAGVGLSAVAHLENNDSYHFFKQLEGALLITGQTGTNVNDLLFLIKTDSAKSAS